jgi:hypothetical protein
MKPAFRLTIALSAVALAAGLSACGGGAAAQSADNSSSATTSTTADGAVNFHPVVSMGPSQLADPGLAAQIPVGPMSQGNAKNLMQFFENEVAIAYQSGNANLLDHYLAGPMLTGNAGTINYLNTQHKHNVFRIDVTAASIDTNSTDRVVFDMAGEMTVDYFVDTTTNKVLEDGLPGPSQLDFLVFFDYNPANHTWYWTGEQDESGNAAGSASSGLSTGGLSG